MVPVEVPTKCEEDSTVINDNNDKADLGDQAKNIVKNCMQKESSKTFGELNKVFFKSMWWKTKEYKISKILI